MRTHATLLSLCAAAGCALSEDPEQLGEIESLGTVYNWTDDAQLSGQSSDRQVGLAYFGGRTYQVHTADNSTQLRYSRFNGFSWSTEQNIPDQFSDRGPAMAVWGNAPIVVYKEAGVNRFRMSRYYGGIWQPPTTAGVSPGLTTLTSSPSLAVHMGALYMAYCRDMGSLDRIQIDRFDGTTWTSAVSYTLAFGDVCKSVAIASLPGDRFDLVFHNYKRFVNSNGTAYNDDYMFEVSGIGAPNANWVPQWMSQRARRPISIVHCNGTSHMVHGGYSNPEGIYWSDRDSSGWDDDAAIPSQASSAGATLVCHDNRTLIVHNGGYPQLWWSEFIE